MKNLTIATRLALFALTAGLVAGDSSTRRTPDNTYTGDDLSKECYDDGTCAQVSEWDYSYSTEYTVSGDNGGAYDSNTYDTTNNNYNYNYNYNYANSPSSVGGSSGDSSGVSAGSSNGHGGHHGGHGRGYGSGYGSGNYNGEVSNNVQANYDFGAGIDGHHQRRHGGDFLGDLIRLPGNIAADVVDNSIAGGITGRGLGNIGGGDRGNLGGRLGFRARIGSNFDAN